MLLGSVPIESKGGSYTRADENEVPHDGGCSVDSAPRMVLPEDLTFS